MSEKTKIGELLQKIGNFFEELFNAAERNYNKQSPEIQNALKEGSEILDIINSNIGEKSSLVLVFIQQAFPHLTYEKLSAALNKVAEVLNVVDAIQAPTLEETIENLQKHLESKSGGDWAGVISLAAKTISYFLAPKGSKWDIFESLMVFVYHKFVKK